MGDHSGAVNVYGVPRPRWLAPLAPVVQPPWSSVVALFAVVPGAMIIAARPVAAIVVLPVLAALFAGALVLRMTTPGATIVDRHRWNQVEPRAG
jgi:hypothetical protein